MTSDVRCLLFCPRFGNGLDEPSQQEWVVRVDGFSRRQNPGRILKRTGRPELVIAEEMSVKVFREIPQQFLALCVKLLSRKSRFAKDLEALQA